MPLRQKVTGACAALGLVLLLAGCGGSQNPVRTVNAAAPFFDGWWDGVWAIPLFIWRITGNTYGLHAVHAGPAYNTGWVFGVICLAVFLWVFAAGFDLPGFIVGAALVFALFVIIYGLSS